MLKYLLVLILFPLLSKSNGNVPKFVYQDISSHGYYLCFNINNDSFLLVKNYDLFLEFIKKGEAEKNYIDFVEYAYSFEYVDYTLFREFESVTTIYNVDDSLMSLAEDSFDIFLSQYLNDGSLNNEVDYIQIIYILFEHNIFVKSDCESGMLYAPQLLKISIPAVKIEKQKNATLDSKFWQLVPR